MATVETLLAEAYKSWNDAAALGRLGRELHDRNRLAAAKEILERAVELAPDRDPDTWAILSYAYMRGFEHEPGLAALRRGIEATGSMELKATLASFASDEAEGAELRKELEDSEVPGIVASRISKSFYDGAHDAALAEIRKLREQHPDDPDVADTFSWMLMNGKSMGVVGEDAVREHGLPIQQRRIDEEPDRIAPRMMKVMMLANLEDWDAVLEETAAALEVFPDEETLLQFRGRALREKGDLDRSVLALARAIGCKPSFAGARVDLCKTYEAMEKHDLAEEVVREIPVANPGYPGGPVSVALFLARRERWDEAEKTFVEAYPGLPDWMKKVLPGNPAAKPLLEREAVKAVLEPQD
jgi:tetratricopeptide (TPR) repeat protein